MTWQHVFSGFGDFSGWFGIMERFHGSLPQSGGMWA
jgi:hypothetical protein